MGRLVDILLFPPGFPWTREPEHLILRVLRD